MSSAQKLNALFEWLTSKNVGASYPSSGYFVLRYSDIFIPYIPGILAEMITQLCAAVSHPTAPIFTSVTNRHTAGKNSPSMAMTSRSLVQDTRLTDIAEYWDGEGTNGGVDKPYVLEVQRLRVLRREERTRKFYGNQCEKSCGAF
ncbi:hypothetical protein ARMGADRAFT_1040444 [Armillaria gallica]|uniref:Uncharacterized protein n=1 Tax=Armillaria gallica TaxID=47427 RepID=A0A2H3C9Z2_ARMGA|nr:hypothetical protein ARMGADRAFT_1040444 [Armillaria gallica]